MTTDHETIQRRRLKELPLILLVILIGGWLGLRHTDPPPDRAEEAGALFDAGSRAEALALLEEILATDPGNAGAHLQLARIALVDEDLAEAEAHLRRATEHGAENADAWTALGAFLFSTGRGDEARPALETAIRTDPRSAEAHATYGQVLEAAGQISDAHPHYEKARRLEPGTPLYWLLEARLHWKRFQPELARTALAGATASAERPLNAQEEKLQWEVKDDLDMWPEGPPRHAPSPPNPSPETPSDSPEAGAGHDH